MRRVHSFRQERPRLFAEQRGKTLVIEISVPSSDLVRTIQDLTRSDRTPNLERRQYDGLLKGSITWSNPVLNGEERRFSVEGVDKESANAFSVVIFNASAGFVGGGPEELARALALLGIGEADFLMKLLCTPYPTRTRSNRPDDFREAWKEMLGGSDFGANYS